MRGSLLIVALAFVSPALAHDEWANGGPVPAWVKASCCGPADAHHLRPDQVHRVSDEYYEVDGYKRKIPAQQALPSQDGEYWIFYREGGEKQCAPEAPGGKCWTEDQSGVYCFFVPMEF